MQNPVFSTKRILKIAIATTGRFHVLDLARELSRLGHEVKFYSYVPKKRAVRYGLPPACHISLLPYLFPLVILSRLLGRWARPYASKWIHLCSDWLVCRKLQACDVFIGMSGIYLAAPKLAKKKFGAKIFIERGSRHIQSQYAILRELPGVELPSNFDIQRELTTYEIADKVVIPSSHVRDSFLEYGFSDQRLFINPYGVDTRLFVPDEQETAIDKAIVIFTGTWCQRKGADLVIETVKRLDGLTLLHVGPIGDQAFPNDPSFIHYAAVDQMRLPEFYRKANIFVLPSREEGFGLVIAQALGCGLPVVCTERTGGPDLIPMMDYPEAIITVPTDNIEALANGMRKALSLSRIVAGKDFLGEKGRQSMSWAAYGKRYEVELLNVMMTRN